MTAVARRFGWRFGHAQIDTSRVSVWAGWHLLHWGLGILVNLEEWDDFVSVTIEVGPLGFGMSVRL